MSRCYQRLEPIPGYVTIAGRIHNFGAGPAVLPLEVVEECQKSLPNLDNSGFGLIEISHRSQTFQNIVEFLGGVGDYVFMTSN